MAGSGFRTGAALVMVAAAIAGCGGEGQGLKSPEILGAAPGTPGGLTADASYVYWTSSGSGLDRGTVLRVGRGGGEPTVLVRGQDQPFEIALSGSLLYWMNQGSGDTSGALMTATKSVGGPVLLADRQSAARDLWLGKLGGGATVVLWTAPREKDAGKRLKQFDLQSRELTDDLAPAAQEPDSVVSDGSSVFWTDAKAGTVSRRDVSSGSVAEIAKGQDDPRGIALGSAYVFWTNLGRPELGLRGSVMRVSASDAAPERLAEHQDIGGRGKIVASDRWVYWFNVEGSTHTLMALPIGGGAPREVALAPGTDIVDLAIWDRRIYWTVAGELDGRVLAVDEL